MIHSVESEAIVDSNPFVLTRLFTRHIDHIVLVVAVASIAALALIH